MRTSLPSIENSQVFIDFDGTLTTNDVIDQLIYRFSINDSWKEIEKLWVLQEIGSRQCLSDELALVRIDDEQLEVFLNSIQLDAGAGALLKLFKRHDIPVTVLSDGIDYFIKRILERHGIGGLSIRCNKMVRKGEKIGLEFPYQQADCQASAAHCKCASACVLGVTGRKSIYIGDGRSDLCAARKAEVVFAKGELAKCLTKEGRSFYPFATLGDICEVLTAAWAVGGK
ncbi:MAG TPA: MtnX-like HAD-IB family phosphatase [Tepidisphaeraceae bacterium]|nr:MtnX-like HAD-IB family phosphatase [Tepidisphaeraceae bacterium]